MKRITVYYGSSHTDYAEFFGEEADATVNDDGTLVIHKWETKTGQGTTTFAKCRWTSVYVVNLKQL